MLRCPLCAGLDHERLYGEFLRCRLCSLGFVNARYPLPSLESYRIGAHEFQFYSWNNVVTRLTRRFPVGSQQDFYFSPSTVRMFAVRDGRHASSVESSFPFVSGVLPWSFGPTLWARIHIWPDNGRQGPDPRLTLGIIATPDAWQEVLDRCLEIAEHAAEAVVLLDTSDGDIAAALEATLRRSLTGVGWMQPRVIAHPLQANFAAQRNRIQQAARTEWVIQLDCDERLTAGARNGLSHILDDAEREGWDAVALTRRNMVNGSASALYPDVQYRLLRRSVRFTRAVHEYPVVGRRQRSFVNLGPGIIHIIDSARLQRRQLLYESLQDGAGRPHDTALLRMPLDSDIALPE